MKQSIKKVLTLFTLLLSFSFWPINITQASGLEAVLKGAVSYIYLGNAVKDMDENHQDELLQNYQETTGVLKDQSYNDRVKGILNRLTSTDEVKRSYVVYVTPDEDINAFMALGRVMAVNKGTMDLLDDDALAYVIGHELGHGENYDITNGVKKQIALSSALSAAVADSSTAGNVIANVAGNFITNEMFTMQQEEAADEKGFAVMTKAGYNPGGAAASMAIIRNKYGDNYVNGIAKLIMPNNHPKTSARIRKNVERMKKYSYGCVDVVDNIVQINGKDIYKPEDGYGYTGEIRAYLMAGKIAKYYHDHKDVNIDKLYADGNIVYLDGIGIVTANSEAEASQIIMKMKIAMASKSPVSNVSNKEVKKHQKVEFLKDFKQKQAKKEEIAF